MTVSQPEPGLENAWKQKLTQQKQELENDGNTQDES